MKRNILIIALFTIILATERQTIIGSLTKCFDSNLKHKIERETYRSSQTFCFEKGTPVTMADGSSKPIKEIIPGDRILSVNIMEMNVEEDIVEDVDSVIYNNFVKITFDDLTMNVNTDDHLYYVKGRGWCSVNPESSFKKYKIRVGNLKPGDNCYKIQNGKLINVRISIIQRIPDRHKGFNIKLQKNANFFAGGKLVSTSDRP